MSEFNPNVEALLAEIKEAMKEACSHYIFEYNCEETRRRFQQELEDIWKKADSQWEDVKQYYVCTNDPVDSNIFLFGPRQDAPDWVWRRFNLVRRGVNPDEKIDDTPITIDFNILENGEVKINKVSRG